MNDTCLKHIPFNPISPFNDISELLWAELPDAVDPSPFTKVSSLSTALVPSTGLLPLATGESGLSGAGLDLGEEGGAGSGATGMTGTLTSTANFLSL